jgi:CheY-specific phosphatase CheX
MSIKFFGQFLLEKGVVTAEQLLSAVKVQQKKNLRFGDYARAKGHLTDNDINHLHGKQKHTDMMIGELAVKLGMLDQEQVDELLTMQENDHIFIGEALRQNGYISHDVLNRELDLFREDQRRYVPGVISVPAGVKDAESIKVIADLTRKMLQRIAQLETKAGIGEMFNGEPQKNFAVVFVDLSGAVDYEFILSAPREVAMAMASGFMGGDASGEPDDILVDSVKEFCNITCGSVMARMAKKGKHVKLTPPQEVAYPDGECNIVQGRNVVCYPLISTAGKISLILVEK